MARGFSRSDGPCGLSTPARSAVGSTCWWATSCGRSRPPASPCGRGSTFCRCSRARSSCTRPSDPAPGVELPVDARRPRALPCALTPKDDGTLRRGPGRCPSSTCISTHSRSEEHTSELQSQSNLVCRLLLEKKKTITNLHNHNKKKKKIKVK